MSEQPVSYSLRNLPSGKKVDESSALPPELVFDENITRS